MNRRTMKRTSRKAYRIQAGTYLVESSKNVSGRIGETEIYSLDQVFVDHDSEMSPQTCSFINDIFLGELNALYLNRGRFILLNNGFILVECYLDAEAISWNSPPYRSEILYTNSVDVLFNCPLRRCFIPSAWHAFQMGCPELRSGFHQRRPSLGLSCIDQTTHHKDPSSWAEILSHRGHH